MIRRLVIAVALAALLGGCIGFIGDPTVPPTVHGDPTAPAANLTIFAASSLKEAFEHVRSGYESIAPNITLALSFDSSAALETQIEQGAPVDVFLSADTTNPARLRAGDFTAFDPVDFAGNTLVILVAPGSEPRVTSPFDLGRSGVKVIAAGDQVPITRYATQLVENLSKLPGAPTGFEAAYAANVVSREDNVRAVAAKVELGEGDAAIVYATDARSPRDTTTIGIPAGANVSATYAGVVLKASPHPREAAEFLDWLAGPEGYDILARFGFVPPPA